MARADLSGRTCMVTGATSGIGEETALALASMGARVLLVGRSRERGERVLERIAREAGRGDAELRIADLASLGQVRQLAEGFLATDSPLHVLVCNAGVFDLRRETTMAVARDSARTTARWASS